MTSSIALKILQQICAKIANFIKQSELRKRSIFVRNSKFCIHILQERYFVMWLPKIGPFLPTPIPIPIAKGLSTQEYPYPWSIYYWLEGSNPKVGALQHPIALAHELAAFILARMRHSLNDRYPNGKLRPDAY